MQKALTYGTQPFLMAPRSRHWNLRYLTSLLITCRDKKIIAMQVCRYCRTGQNVWNTSGLCCHSEENWAQRNLKMFSKGTCHVFQSLKRNNSMHLHVGSWLTGRCLCTKRPSWKFDTKSTTSLQRALMVKKMLIWAALGRALPASCRMWSFHAA